MSSLYYDLYAYICSAAKAIVFDLWLAKKMGCPLYLAENPYANLNLVSKEWRAACAAEGLTCAARWHPMGRVCAANVDAQFVVDARNLPMPKNWRVEVPRFVDDKLPNIYFSTSTYFGRFVHQEAAALCNSTKGQDEHILEYIKPLAVGGASYYHVFRMSTGPKGKMVIKTGICAVIGTIIPFTDPIYISLEAIDTMYEYYGHILRCFMGSSSRWSRDNLFGFQADIAKTGLLVDNTVKSWHYVDRELMDIIDPVE
jgi:hypothetical protein